MVSILSDLCVSFRGLLFVAYFTHLYPTEESLNTALAMAYEKTLKPFHNFVVRGVVSVSISYLLHLLVVNEELDMKEAKL